MTTEIGFALFAGAVSAGAAYFGVTEFLPNVVGALRGRWNVLGPLAVTATAVVFVAVVSIVLTRFRRAVQAGRVPAPPGGPGAAQPSQPGRTNPDS